MFRVLSRSNNKPLTLLSLCPSLMLKIWYISSSLSKFIRFDQRILKKLSLFQASKPSFLPTNSTSEWNEQNIKKQRTGHFYRFQNCPKTHFFRKTRLSRAFFCKKSAYFRVFQPSVKKPFFCVSLEIMKSTNYSAFHSIKTSLFSVFRWLFRFL